MTWVTSQSGDLVNLSPACVLGVRRDPIDGLWGLLVYYPADPEPVEVGRFASRGEATALLIEVSRTLPARDVAMPPCPEPSAVPTSGGEP